MEVKEGQEGERRLVDCETCFRHFDIVVVKDGVYVCLLACERLICVDAIWWSVHQHIACVITQSEGESLGLEKYILHAFF